MDLNFHNMAQKNKSQLVAEIDAIYVDCGTECITPEAVNAFEKDKTDSYAILNEDNDFSGVGAWTKQIREHKGANITVGSTLNLTNDGNYFHVTGASTVITSITTRQHGTRVSFYFVNSHTLTHSTSLILPNAIDYKVAAGEILEFVSEGSGNWRFKNSSKVIAGQYVPTVTASGFDSAGNISSMYSVQGDIMTSTHYIEVVNDGAATSGIVEIDPPAGITLSGSDVDTVGVAMPKDLTNLSNVQLFFVKQSGGKIAVEIGLAAAFGTFELTLSCQSKLA